MLLSYLTAVEYYTVPFNSDLKGACADQGYGIPVTPSSKLERWKIGELYPGEVFRVSACNESAQMEPPNLSVRKTTLLPLV